MNPKAIEEILRVAGKLAKKAFQSKTMISDKAPLDQQIQVEVEIEDFLKQQLSILYPESYFYGEESGYSGKPGSSLFVLDPIDGTTNFIFGVPFFSISLAEILDGTVNLAMVYNPITEDFFYADREHPSTINGSPIHVSMKDQLEESFVSLGFSANQKNINRYLQEWPQVFQQARKAMPLLSPSLNLCSVAQGKIDAFIDFGCSFEGQIAGAYILKRAGGKVRDYEGSDYDFRKTGIVASNGRLSL